MYNKKIALLYILDILKEYSDSNHPLTQKEIINKLQYLYNIEIERKTISSSINLLIEYGYDINRNNKQGYYLNEREFNENEIKFLIDAIYSSKVINSNQTISLCKKLNSFLSKYDQKDYSYINKTDDINKSSMKNTFLNIELINEAIKNNKKISFKYLYFNEEHKLIERKNGYKYKLSPYFLVNNFSKYYLIGKMDKHNNYSNYRIEFMKDIEITDEQIIENHEEYSQNGSFNATKYLNDHIYIFGGDVVYAKLEIIDDYAISVLVDWFGKNVNFYDSNNKKYASIRSNEKALYYWLLQYQSYVKVVEPQSLVDKIILTLENSIKLYK